MHTLHAVAEKFSFSIEAAIQNLPLNVKRSMAAADVALVGKISVADLDRKLAAAERLTTLDRLALKIGLEKSGLLGN